MGSHPLLLLAAAIACEVIATINLRVAFETTRLWPGVAVVVGYVSCFVLLGLALRAGLNLGAGYAIWSGAGTAIVAIVSVLLFKERLTPIAVIGLLLIVVGVVTLHLGGASHDSRAGAAPGRTGSSI